MDKQTRLLARFTADQIRRIVMVGNQPKFMKALDRVIEDIYDYPKLATKVASARNENELLFVVESFGFDAVQIFRDSQLYAALEDLVHMDYDLRKLNQGMKNAKRKNGKVPKGDIKLYDRIAKLYRRTIKAVCDRLNIKHRRANRFKSSYQSAKDLVRRHEDSEFFGSFGVFDSSGTFYPDDDDLYMEQGTDLFAEALGGSSRGSSRRYQSFLSPGYRVSSMMRELDEEDDDDFDNGPLIGDYFRGVDTDSVKRITNARFGQNYYPEMARPVSSGVSRANASLADLLSSRPNTTPSQRVRQSSVPTNNASAPADKTDALLERLIRKVDASNDLLAAVVAQNMNNTPAQEERDEFTTPAGYHFQHVKVIPPDEDAIEEAEMDAAFDAQNAGINESPDGGGSSTEDLNRASLIDMVNGIRSGTPTEEPELSPEESTEKTKEPTEAVSTAENSTAT